MIRLRQVEDLAKEIKRDQKQTLAHLNELGVKVIDGFFDSVRFEAAVSEPQWLREKRNAWSLSPRVGLGAIKHLLDPLGVIMVEHECRGSQYLMLRRAGPSIAANASKKTTAGTGLGTQKVLCKLYYRGAFLSTRAHKTAAFDIHNFLRADAPATYLGVCFEGPMMWAFSKRELVSVHTQLSKREYGDRKWDLGISAAQQDREFGGVHALVNERSRWLLTDASQLGL